MLNISRGTASVRFSNVEKPPSSKKSAQKHEVPDWMKKQIKEYANEHAKTGDYMGGAHSEFHTMRRKYIKENISPDRTAAIAAVMPLINNAMPRDSARFLMSGLDGKEFSGMMSVGRFGDTCLWIYDESGDLVSSYSSTNGGWRNCQTKAERSFYNEVSLLYSNAWHAAREKEASNATAPVTAPAQSGKLDVAV